MSKDTCYGPTPLRQAALYLAFACIPSAAGAAEQRCGWFDNPTPGNLFLRDRQAEWVLSLQMGYSAPGLDENLPDMTRRGWVETNGHYG